MTRPRRAVRRIRPPVVRSAYADAPGERGGTAGQRGTQVPRAERYGEQPARRYLGPAVGSLSYFGHGRLCPICGCSSPRFRPFGRTPRDDAQCLHCGSLERDRLAWLFIRTRTSLFSPAPKTMLHVSPESCLADRFRAHLGDGYLSADRSHDGAMVRMDITDIGYPDESFDVVYCSHVLEHVDDDRRALRELHRVLRPGGWAILLVPIMGDQTFEDPQITDPQERLTAYGQEDHVRRYGPDVVDRFREAGFGVQVIRATDLVAADAAVRFGMTPATGELFYCTK